MCGRNTRPDRPSNKYTIKLGSTRPKLNCTADMMPMHRRLDVLSKKAPHMSGVLVAANSTLASCKGACKKNRTCTSTAISTAQGI
jgi:hypothetical protein